MIFVIPFDPHQSDLGSQESSKTSIAVSKLCCPVCWELLQIMRADPGLKPTDFAVQGYHTRFYPVDLPEWLPVGVIDQMVKRFKGYLERELQIFSKSSKKYQHNVCQSWESHASGVSDDGEQLAGGAAHMARVRDNPKKEQSPNSA
jgi:hypothetical protein